MPSTRLPTNGSEGPALTTAVGTGTLGCGVQDGAKLCCCATEGGAPKLDCCHFAFSLACFAFTAPSIERAKPNVRQPMLRQMSAVNKDTKKSNPKKLSRT